MPQTIPNLPKWQPAPEGSGEPCRLTIFFDGQCPLCAKEMRALKARDHKNLLQLEDIWQDNFEQHHPAINQETANRVLHAVDDSGNLLLGLDVTARAWSMVGINRYNWLRWQLIKPVADFFYRRFANNRYGISKLLTGRARTCSETRCTKKRN